MRARGARARKGDGPECRVAGALLREAWVAGEAPGAVDEHAGADPLGLGVRDGIDLAVLRRHQLRAALDDARVGVACPGRDGGVDRVSSEVLHGRPYITDAGLGDPVVASRDVDGDAGTKRAGATPNEPWRRDAAEVAARLGTDVERGLPAAEASRLARLGPNLLEAAEQEPAWRKLWPSSPARSSTCSSAPSRSRSPPGSSRAPTRSRTRRSSSRRSFS